MDTTTHTTSLASIYMNALQGVSANVKLELISLLTESVRESQSMTKNEKVNLRNCFHGEWGKPNDIKYCDDLRHEAISNPNEIESW